jgi:hypothetical protein
VKRKEKLRQTELFGRKVEASQWRKRLLERLRREDETELADRLAKCGQVFPLWCKGCGHRHDAETKCNRKWCPSCAPKRGNERAARLRHAIRLMKWPMHITLTVPNVDWEAAPRTLLVDLLQSFKRLRDSVLWQRCVKGGMVACEVTDKGNGLHPHLHIVCDARWIALKTPEPHHTDTPEQRAYKYQMAAQELQSRWASATRQPEHKSLWIRRCDAGAAAEIMKYALKAEDALNCQGRIGPIINMLDAGRMVRGFGSMFGVKWPEDDERPLLCQCGGHDWTTLPVLKCGESLSAKERWKREHDAELDAKLDAIAREEALRKI